MPILATKLYIPRTPPNLVNRLRLLERLNEGRHRKLTLISAPAGFGKTTLVSEWVAGSERGDHAVRAAWLSLDEGDNEPTRFLTYLVAALQTIAPDSGSGLLSLLQSPQPPPTESLLTALLNEITTIPEPFMLVLDDYHLIDARAADQALTYLLEHLPPHMHLVIATREDPQLPLARLRARGHLTELRAADLRFTPSEASAFLSQVMHLSLTAEDIAALEDRTEGWIAGLQLAALSMQGHRDIPGFIRAFAGDHRYIVDYLVAEVLERQPEGVRNFLLQTSMLDRLSGALCDAVTGQEGGNARLEALEHGNFFVVPLDERRHWYRYHHLFAEVLSAHLLAEQPDQLATLHRRASEWYEQQGSSSDAIRHALAAGDFERVADLVEVAVPALARSRQEATALGWLKTLPDELVRNRPVLSVYYAGALLLNGEIEGVEARLRDAERWLEKKTDGNASATLALAAETSPESIDHAQDKLGRRMVIVDEEAFRGLPGSIAIYRAAIALALGDVANTMNYARRALDLVPDDDYHWRGSAAGLLGLALWASGDLEEGYRMYAECMALVQRVGYLSDALGCAIALADIRIAQGRLREAMHLYEQALQLAGEQGAPVLRGTSDMYVGMSEIQRERNDLHAATQLLLKSKEPGDHMGLPQNRYRWRVAMARIREAEGDMDGALDLLAEAERLYAGDFFPNVRPIAALRARVWIVQGRMGDARGWTREQGLSVTDDLSYLREFEYITLARLLLAEYISDRADRSLREAVGLLERLLHAAQAGARTGRVIEILIVQALAQQAQGDIPAALIPLQKALSLAEPEGYTRIFVDEGIPMAALLEKAAKQGIAPNYVHQLLTAMGKALERATVKQALIEPLSERELEVLRLLGSDLNGPEIARELVVSLNTMRTHTKNIFSKLGVDNRRAAVRRAEELHLF